MKYKNLLLRENPSEYFKVQYERSKERAARWTEKSTAFEDRHPHMMNKIYLLVSALWVILIAVKFWRMV